MAPGRTSRPPRWSAIPVRVVVMTFIGTLLTFALSLLLAILGTVLISAIRRINPDMRLAYSHIALPAALIAGSIVFVAAAVLEIRHYRQTKMLAALEKIV